MNDQIKPTVSVIMPVYNVELYVAEAINSILNQTFTDFELIVLDDCSPDRSAEIVKSFIDKRIVYHRNEKNQGLAENLNTGLKMAKGKYIARMASVHLCKPQLDTHSSSHFPRNSCCCCFKHNYGAGKWQKPHSQSRKEGF